MSKIKNPYVKKLLKENRILIKYIYDKAGYRRAAVVAYKDAYGVHVGASIVHKDDYRKRKIKHLIDIPAMQELVKALEEVWQGSSTSQKVAELSALFTLDEINRIGDIYVSEPMFDRDFALKKAIKNAKEDHVIFDRDIIIALNEMKDRAGRFFKEQI